MTALVFNCAYNGLSIIQELGRHGIPVLALDSERSVGTVSRYARFHRCPDPSVAEDAFIAFLMRMGQDFAEKPVLFPTNDHWAVAISRHKQALSAYYIPCVADYSAIELVIEKQRFYDWALRRGFPVPRSWRSTDVQQIPDDAFPLAAKPEYRRIASNDQETSKLGLVLDRLRLTVLRNKQDLTNFLTQQHDLLTHFLFQEYVEGLSDCMYTIGVYANRDYKIMGLFSGRKIRGFPPDIGDCIVGQNDAVPSELKDLVKTICKEIGYQGIAEFEFKRDAITSMFKLIEINPRSWSWVGITPACGVSLPWIAYCDLTGFQAVEYTESNFPDGSVKYVKILADIQNCIWKNRRAGYPQWHFSLREWWHSLRANKLVVAEFAADDLKPGIYAVAQMFRTGLAGLVGTLMPGRKVP